MMKSKYLILGAGPTGLGAATRLRDRGKSDWILLEATKRFGGLAHSWVDEQGFTWDLGGHVQFSHYETFDRYMDEALGKDGWYEHERESWVRMLGTWVPYPFQNNLHRLPPEQRWECVKGLLDVAGYRLQVAGLESEELATCNLQPSTFKDWILATFGAGVAEIFMLPYNYKVWAYPPETMMWNWIGERVSVPPLENVLHSVCTGEDAVSWGPNATFRFPKKGGTGAVWEAIGRGLQACPAAGGVERCRLQVEAVRIDVESKVVYASDGAEYHYENLISTIPLNHLIRLTEGNVVPLAEAEKLVYSTTHVVGLGMEGVTPDDLKTKCWMYFPEENSPYYRVTVFTNYSPENAPRPGEQWSLMTETSESSRKVMRELSCGPEAQRVLLAAGVGEDEQAEMSDENLLKKWTTAALMDDGLLPASSKVISVSYKGLNQGYPTPWKGRDETVDPILRAFEKVDIFSRGRFGAWKYEVANQDHSFAQGYECVERVLHDGDSSLEPTLHTPGIVNSRRNA